MAQALSWTDVETLLQGLKGQHVRVNISVGTQGAPTSGLAEFEGAVVKVSDVPFANDDALQLDILAPDSTTPAVLFVAENTTLKPALVELQGKTLRYYRGTDVWVDVAF